MALVRSYRKAIILGAAGFIGVNLASYLVRQGYEVICLGRSNSPQWPDSVKSVIGDFSSMPEELLDELNDALVFHLVSSFRPMPTTVQAAEEVSFDLVTTLHYLEATKGRNIRWVFLSSGGTVYGRSERDCISETEPVAPICTYGLVKATIENYFCLYRTLHNIDYVVVRLSNPYGPWQSPLKPQGVIASIIYKALRNEPFVVWGDGTNIRDYIYIADAVEGIYNIGKFGIAGEIYNIGSGVGRSINELIELVGEVLERKLIVQYNAARTIDVKRNVLDTSKFFDCISERFSCTAIDVGISETVAWMRDNFKAGF